MKLFFEIAIFLVGGVEVRERGRENGEGRDMISSYCVKLVYPDNPKYGGFIFMGEFSMLMMMCVCVWVMLVHNVSRR